MVTPSPRPAGTTRRGFLLRALTLGALLAGCGNDGREHRARLPAVAVRRLDGAGGQADLRSLAGKPMVLNLWAPWCVPCRREMPAFQRVHATTPGVRFVGLAEHGDREASLAFARSLGITYDLYIAADGAAFAELDAAVLPMTLFVDSRGRIRARHLGALSERALRTRVATLLRA